MENEKIRITGLPARKLERSKIGEVIWFMYSPDNSRSSHWIRGELERRVDKYTTAKESGFTRNSFIVKNLRIINSWNGMYTIPENLTVNLSKDAAWTFEA